MYLAERSVLLHISYLSDTLRKKPRSQPGGIYTNGVPKQATVRRRASCSTAAAAAASSSSSSSSPPSSSSSAAAVPAGTGEAPCTRDANRPNTPRMRAVLSGHVDANTRAYVGARLAADSTHGCRRHPQQAAAAALVSPRLSTL